MLLTLTGCPFKDDYFLDAARGGAGGGGSNGGQLAGASGGVGASTGGVATVGGAGACDCSAGRVCAAGACVGGWVSMAAPPPSFAARERAAFASFDEKVFIFGGRDANDNVLDSAAIYDLASDSWEVLPVDAATPSPRELATAVWTGSQVLVFGGRSASGTEYYPSGALYDPASGLWSTIKNAVVARASVHGGAIANEVVFHGGLTTGSFAATGTTRYDLISDTWQLADSQNGPSPLLGATVAFRADALFVHGGLNGSQRQDSAYRYDLVQGSWSALPRGPTARSFAFGVLDGSSFYVWAGRDNTSLLADGAVFGTSWTAMKTANSPSLRSAPPRLTGWAFALGPGDVVFLGGQDEGGNFLTDGGRYSLTTGWSGVPSWPSGEDHGYGVAALVGREIVLWGGTDGSAPTVTGERWVP